MTPATRALLAIPERPVPGVALLHRLYAQTPATVDDILAAALEIEAAINEADALARRAEKAVKRCLDLKPVSAPRTPSGF